MADVTISRGIIVREDFLTATWATGSGVVASTDGDILSLSGTTSSQGYATGSFTAFSTTTCPRLLIRAKGAGTIDFKVFYLDGAVDTFTLTLTTTYSPFLRLLTSGKSVTTISFVNQSIAGTNSIDFVQFYKEDLTFPGIIQPMPLSTGRIVAVLPILQRDGEVLQDLGSKSPEIIIQGALVSTITPTNHTAAEWWDLLEGLVLEGANETWQWVTSDRIHYKYLPIDLSRSEILSRKNYYEFTLRLKRFDVLSQTADRLGISY